MQINSDINKQFNICIETFSNLYDNNFLFISYINILLINNNITYNNNNSFMWINNNKTKILLNKINYIEILLQYSTI